MFKIFKYSYTGYQYFGGDEVFLMTKVNILIDINKLEDSIEVSTLFKIISSYPNFIQDGHFTMFIEDNDIYSDYFTPSKKYFHITNEEFQIDRDDEGYFTYIDGKKTYIFSINNNKNIRDYIKPSLSKEGNIVYNFGIIDTERFKNLNVSFKNGNDNFQMSVNLFYNKPATFKNTGYNINRINGIPIIENRRMLTIADDEEGLDNFIKDATKFKMEDLLIIDIRGNHGGISNYPIGCFEIFTRYNPSSESFFASLDTITTHINILHQPKNSEDLNLEIKKELNAMINKKETGVLV